MASSVNTQFKVKGPLLEAFGGQVYVNKRLIGKIGDWTPFWTSQRAHMQGNFRAVWMEGQTAWPQISKKYRDWKIKHGFSGRIMQMRNWLLHALLGGQLEVKQPKQWIWGIDAGNSMWYSGRSAVPYPEIQAQKRPFAIVLAATIKVMTKDMRKYLVRLMTKK
jgi:hypothetical protein